MFSTKYTQPYPVASVRMRLPPKATPLPVRVPAKRLLMRLYWPKRYEISRAPTPMSPAGTSTSSPMWRASSVIIEWQNRMTSASLFPLGLKSAPPLAPPIGSPVRLFLNVCSKPRNFSTDRVTSRWKRSPPL